MILSSLPRYNFLTVAQSTEVQAEYGVSAELKWKISELETAKITKICRARHGIGEKRDR